MDKELVVAYKPKSGVSEAIKTIRTNLQFSSVDNTLKKVLVTSSIPSEGKSFISANLAVAFAQAGNKVLIVDCDMRRGRQHEVFGVNNDFGLSNLLIDDVKENYQNYLKKTEVKNLYILTRGMVPPNPSELLSSSKNEQLSNILSSKFDIVIYDGAPVGGLTDSVVMAGLVDKIVIVCAYKETPMDYLINTKKQLEPFKEKIAGVVINKMPAKNNHYYSNYYT